MFLSASDNSPNFVFNQVEISLHAAVVSVLICKFLESYPTEQAFLGLLLKKNIHIKIFGKSFTHILLKRIYTTLDFRYTRTK